jgi:hypothetical protein
MDDYVLIAIGEHQIWGMTRLTPTIPDLTVLAAHMARVRG